MPPIPNVHDAKHKGVLVENLSVSFGGLMAIADVGMALRRHEIVGLIGPNGAGKTTFVNCLTGFQQPSGGRIVVDGKSTSAWSAADFRRYGIARTFQAGRLFSAMTVSENVEVAALGLGATRRAARALVDDLLGWMRIADKANLIAGSLAYSDERRVGIARALAMSPSFILLDEPAAGMSEFECDELMELVVAMPKQFGCGVLLIEHNMRVVMTICERIVVLDGGRAIAEGTPREIMADQSVISAYLGSTA